MNEIERLRTQLAAVKALMNEPCRGIGCTGNCDEVEGHVPVEWLRDVLDDPA